MICPSCKSDKIRVIDTRKFDTVVFRLRVCELCGVVIKTEEQQIEIYLPKQHTKIEITRYEFTK